MEKIKKENKLIKNILIIVSLLVAIIIALLLLEFSPNLLGKIIKEPKLYLIEDECGLIVGRLIHQIKDEGECKIKCRNECDIRNEDFHDSEFIERENACHICHCYCK